MTLDVARVRWTAGGRLVVDDVDVTVPAGSFGALIGPNGSGKTSLLRLIAGVLGADAGTVGLDGEDLLALPRRERARRTALLEQESAVQVPLSVLDAVLLGRTPHRRSWAPDSAADREIALDALERVEGAHLVGRSLTTLSGGERQRVHLARALAQQPALLLLDEPTNHLDVHAQLATLGLVAALTTRGVTALAALHDLNLAASYCDHVVLLSAGRVVAAGGVADVLRPEVIDPVYGVRTTVLSHPSTHRPVLSFAPEQGSGH